MRLSPVEPRVVEYARSGDLSIAYQVMGDGPVDLVFVPFLISAVFSSEYEPFSTFYERLASFSRLILFDKRGTGASDRPRTPPTLEAQMDDVRAVLDAVGSEQTALFGNRPRRPHVRSLRSDVSRAHVGARPLQPMETAAGDGGGAQADDPPLPGGVGTERGD